ncbi:hypothetical protein MRB53_007214 [Persea americana]|uniref:Uncharacterized protein n=1 Tax=Persea americana TaxID=3435 RepID=A0ACC2MIK7_PERAE|nr:hypothetical protein MRB53_007214 [Persea americana]
MPSAGSQDKGHLKESFGGESTRYLKKLQCSDDTTKEDTDRGSTMNTVGEEVTDKLILTTRKHLCPCKVAQVNDTVMPLNRRLAAFVI